MRENISVYIYTACPTSPPIVRSTLRDVVIVEYKGSYLDVQIRSDQQERRCDKCLGDSLFKEKKKR